MTHKDKPVASVSADQDRSVFFHFDLSNGGRVHIPPDQVGRMWNEQYELQVLREANALLVEAAQNLLAAIVMRGSITGSRAYADLCVALAAAKEKTNAG